ncbi:muscular LMNA-interacting protein [Grus japonensis]|uniref:Muscular LMNA-interacting protein n=1 Tax=Grus japonensis TaxID=30415 RepID=A0ABC9WKB6_GRUJA
MQENDLFKAEFILITDSGDEDEVAAASNNVHRPSNGYGPISAQLLAMSHVSPGTGAGKPPGDGHVPGAALPHSTADPQKHQCQFLIEEIVNEKSNLIWTLQHYEIFISSKKLPVASENFN